MTPKLNKEHNLKDSGVSNAADTLDLPRHRWYYYKEGFSPNLVESAISESGLGKNDLLIDPFNGSGTVTLSAAKKKIQSVGFEINPFTSFLAKTKVLGPDKKKFKEEVDKIVQNSLGKNQPSSLEGYSTFTEKEGIKQWLFNTEVIRAFNSGYEEHKNSRSHISQILKLALLSAAMENCNAKKDGKCLRYKKNWKNLNYSRESFVKSFQLITSNIYNDLDEKIDVKTKIVNGDSRRLLSKMDTGYKLCVTSPPYLNTFDYTDIYRPELFLGEFVLNGQDLYKLRLRTVRSHIQAKWKRPNQKSDYGSLYTEVFNKIKAKPDQLMHKEIPTMINAYFEDMQGILHSLKKKALKGASLWMIVSTSAYANEHIPVDLILADIGTKVGWKLQEIGVLRDINKRKSKHSPDITKLRESVVILKT